MCKTIAVAIGTVFWLVCGDVLADDVGDRPADALPRYRLEVGQEMVYRLVSREDPRKQGADAQQPLDQMEWRVFVVGKNDDGSWRLFIRTSIAFLNHEGQVRAHRNSLGYCDLMSDGSYAVDETTAVLKRLCPYELFCRLPDRPSELSTGWRYEPPVEQRLAYDLSVASRDAETAEILGRRQTPYEQMHGWETTRRYKFDLQRGLVTRIVQEHRNVGEPVRNRLTFELDSVRERDPDWGAQFQAETNDYLATYSAWARRVNDSLWLHEAAACETALRDARQLLVAGRAKAHLSILRDMYDDNLHEHDEHVRWTKGDAARRDKFFRQAAGFATDWQAARFDGGTFRLADHRGQIVVLDFWGTNCEYCVLVAPQVSQLAAEYRDKGVIFLGMFDRRQDVDPDKEDQKARSLIKSVYQGIAHLDGTEIAKEYRLREFGLGYPALVILDASGAVHETHSGYAADLPERVRAILDGMLGKAAK